MPARAGPRSGLTVVSSEPHSFPFAHITCCMRVSFESGREMTSLCGGWAPKSRRQQPTPAMVGVVVSLIQWPCGTFVPGAVPEPGCCCLGGIPYCPTVNTLFDKLSDGDAVFSDEVFVRLQTRRSVEVPLP